MIGGFYRLFLWNFKKTSTVSYGAALFFSCLGRFGCRRTGIFRPGENVALPSMPTCLIFFYYDDICSLSALAAMRPLLSRKDLDQPALSRPPRVFVLSFLLFGRCRALFACMRLKTTEFFMSSVSHVKHWFFLFCAILFEVGGTSVMKMSQHEGWLLGPMRGL